MFSRGSSSSMGNNKGKEILVEAEEEQDGNNGSPWVQPPPEMLEAEEALELLKKRKENMVEAEEEEEQDDNGSPLLPPAEEAPDWVQVLIRSRFWEDCRVHQRGKPLHRAEKCIFCVDCFKVICPHCRHKQDKPTHTLLKIRRYVFRSVVSASDMNMLGVDVSYIQTYKCNGHNVVHLRPMRKLPRHRPSPLTPRCVTCNCLLHTLPSRLCSLTCKHRIRTAAAQVNFSGRRAALRLGRPDAQAQAAATSEAQATATSAQAAATSQAQAAATSQAQAAVTPQAQAAATSRPAGRRPRKQVKPRRAPFF